MKHRSIGLYKAMQLLFFIVLSFIVNAQTEVDGIMMTKNNFCTGLMYSHNSWKNYWEGTFNRINQNIGTVATKTTGFNGNYGISNSLNALFGLAYVQTNSSAGTLKGMKGLQDFSLALKWMPVEVKFGSGAFSLYGIAGFSIPLTNYVADFLPLSIGLHSKTMSFRAMADYQLGKFFVTGSGSYVRRSNIRIDRSAYYTTEMHYTNEVEMPDAININFRTGYRSNAVVAELILDNLVTQGGFDIRKNDMPFPSNKMNSMRAGINLKYTVNKIPGLSLIGGGNQTIYGRNVGESFTVYGGAFYVIEFSGKNKQERNKQK